MHILHSQNGNICTILKNRFIITKLGETPLLVQFYHTPVNNNSVKNDCPQFNYQWHKKLLSLPGQETKNWMEIIGNFLNSPFIWKNEAPVLHSDILDGEEVSFDAISFDRRTFWAILVFQGCKPSFSPIVRTGGLLLSQNYTKVPVHKVTFSDPPTVSIIIDKELKTIPFTFDKVVINGQKISSEAEFHCASLNHNTLIVDLLKFLDCDRNEYKYVCIYIYTDYFSYFPSSTSVKHNYLYIEDNLNWVEKTSDYFVYYDVNFSIAKKKDFIEVSFKIKGKSFVFRSDIDIPIKEGLGHIVLQEEAGLCYILLLKIYACEKVSLTNEDIKCSHCQVCSFEANDLANCESISQDYLEYFLENALKQDDHLSLMNNSVVAVDENLKEVKHIEKDQMSIDSILKEENISPFISSASGDMNDDSKIENLNKICLVSYEEGHLFKDDCNNYSISAFLIGKLLKIPVTCEFIYFKGQWIQIGKVMLPQQVNFDAVQSSLGEFDFLCIWKDKRPLTYELCDATNYYDVVGIIIKTVPETVIAMRIQSKLITMELHDGLKKNIFTKSGTPVSCLSSNHFTENMALVLNIKIKNCEKIVIELLYGTLLSNYFTIKTFDRIKSLICLGESKLSENSVITLESIYESYKSHPSFSSQFGSFSVENYISESLNSEVTSRKFFSKPPSEPKDNFCAANIDSSKVLESSTKPFQILGEISEAVIPKNLEIDTTPKSDSDISGFNLSNRSHKECLTSTETEQSRERVQNFSKTATKKLDTNPEKNISDNIVISKSTRTLSPPAKNPCQKTLSTAHNDESLHSLNSIEILDYDRVDYLTCFLAIAGSNCILLKTKKNFCIMNKNVFFVAEHNQETRENDSHFNHEKEFYVFAIKLCHPVRFYDVIIDYFVLAAWQGSMKQDRMSVESMKYMSLVNWTQNSEYHIYKIFSLIHGDPVLREFFLRDWEVLDDSPPKVNLKENVSTLTKLDMYINSAGYNNLLFYAHGKVCAWKENKALLRITNLCLETSASIDTVFCYFNNEVAFINKSRCIQDAQGFSQTLASHLQSDVTYETCFYPCQRQVIFEREVAFCATVVWRKVFPVNVLKYPLPPLGSFKCACKKSFQKASGKVVACSSNDGILSLDTCNVINLNLLSSKTAFCYFIQKSAYVEKSGNVVSKEKFYQVLKDKMESEEDLNALIYPCREQMLYGKIVTLCATLVWCKKNNPPPNGRLRFPLIPLDLNERIFGKGNKLDSSKTQPNSSSVHNSESEKSKSIVPACQQNLSNTFKKDVNMLKPKSKVESKEKVASKTISSNPKSTNKSTKEKKSSKTKHKVDILDISNTSKKAVNMSKPKKKVESKEKVASKTISSNPKSTNESTKEKKSLITRHEKVDVLNCSLVREGPMCCLLKSKKGTYFMNNKNFCIAPSDKMQTKKSLFDFNHTPFISVHAMKLPQPINHCGLVIDYIILAAWQGSKASVVSQVDMFTKRNFNEWTNESKKSEAMLLSLLKNDSVVKKYVAEQQSLLVNEKALKVEQTDEKVLSFQKVPSNYPNKKTTSEDYKSEYMLYTAEGYISKYHKSEGILFFHGVDIPTTFKGPLFCYFNKDVSYINSKATLTENTDVFCETLSQHALSNMIYHAFIYSCTPQIILGKNVTFCAAKVWRKKVRPEAPLKFTLAPLAHSLDSPPTLHEVSGFINACSPNGGILNVPCSELNILKLSSEQTVSCYFSRDIAYVNVKDKEPLIDLISFNDRYKALIYCCQEQNVFMEKINFCAALFWKAGEPNPSTTNIKYHLTPLYPSCNNELIKTNISQAQPSSIDTCSAKSQNFGLIEDKKNSLSPNRKLTKNKDNIYDENKLEDSLSSSQVIYSEPKAKGNDLSTFGIKSSLQHDSLDVSSRDKLNLDHRKDINTIVSKSALIQGLFGKIIYFDGKEGIFLAETKSEYLGNEYPFNFCYFNDTLPYWKEKLKFDSKNKVVDLMENHIFLQTKFGAIVYQCQLHYLHSIRLDCAVGLLWSAQDGIPKDNQICYSLPPIDPTTCQVTENIKAISLDKSTKIKNSQIPSKEKLTVSEKCFSPLQENPNHCWTKVENGWSIPEPAIPVTKRVPGQRREFAAIGIVVEVNETSGKLQSVDQKVFSFTRENCFLFGISLYNTSLLHILESGHNVEFETDVYDDIEEVWVGGGPLATPEETYHKICSWCCKFDVNSETKMDLVRQCDWIPPACDPITILDDSIPIATLD